MNGSTMARHAGSIINRPNCGGNNKAGLAPRVGAMLMSNSKLNRANNTLLGLVCITNGPKTSPAQSAIRAARRY